MPENPKVEDTDKIKEIKKIAESVESIVEFLLAAKFLGYSPISNSRLDEFIDQLWSNLEKEMHGFSDQIGKLRSLFEEGENIRNLYKISDDWPDCIFMNVQDQGTKMLLVNVFLVRFFPSRDSEPQEANTNWSHEDRIKYIAEKIYEEFELCSPYAAETKTNDITIKDIIIKILQANKNFF